MSEAGGQVSAVNLAAPPDRVFDVLLDATNEPEWLRGAKRLQWIEESFLVSLAR